MFENNMHIFMLILITSMINIYYLVNIFNVIYKIAKNQKTIFYEVKEWKKMKTFYNRNKKT